MSASFYRTAPLLLFVLSACVSSPANVKGLHEKPNPYSGIETQCHSRTGWSDPAPPAHIFGNVYMVGTCGIVSLLITSKQGHILIDGATELAASSILANIRQLGFNPREIAYLLSSHEHLDHVGGLAGLKEATAAKLVVRAEARASFESGEASDQDPQHGTLPGFGPVAVDQLIRDGENIELGPISMTAIASPGHAPGGTSWTWRSCNEEICYQFVYADSLGAIAGEQYRFSDHPEYVASFRATIDTIGGLSACDVIISPHPSQTAFFERLSGKAPLADPKGCSKYASDARVRLDERLAQERIP